TPKGKRQALKTALATGLTSQRLAVVAHGFHSCRLQTSGGKQWQLDAPGDRTYINLDAVEFIKWESNNTTTLHCLSGHSLNLKEGPLEVTEQALTGAQDQRRC